MRRIEAKAPKDWLPEERAAFEELVLKGDEVEPEGLAARIEAAHRLVFAYDGNELVGVGALKEPQGHRITVARNSKSPLSAADYPLELGWFYVEKEARDGGIGKEMFAKLLSGVTWGVYATSHTTNDGMHAVLKRYGFTPAGEDYPSTRRKGVVIRLFQKAQSILT
jgi:GNAT superfamily N-acetyltransferase